MFVTLGTTEMDGQHRFHAAMWMSNSCTGESTKCTTLDNGEALEMPFLISRDCVETDDDNSKGLSGLDWRYCLDSDEESLRSLHCATQQSKATEETVEPSKESRKPSLKALNNEESSLIDEKSTSPLSIEFNPSSMHVRYQRSLLPVAPRGLEQQSDPDIEDKTVKLCKRNDRFMPFSQQNNITTLRNEEENDLNIPELCSYSSSTENSESLEEVPASSEEYDSTTTPEIDERSPSSSFQRLE